MKYPKAVSEAIECFSRLPGIGPKSAHRLVQQLLKDSDHHVKRFGDALSTLKTSVGFCRSCFHLTEKGVEQCEVCVDPKRDGSIICVVEDFVDVFAIENTAMYQGRYHVLHGVLSPLNGVGPGELTLSALFTRLQNEEIKEVIVATNPTMEGEATAMYIKNNAPKREDLSISRIAKGMPMGGNIDYTDEVTLGNALSKRVGI